MSHPFDSGVQAGLHACEEHSPTNPFECVLIIQTIPCASWGLGFACVLGLHSGDMLVLLGSGKLTLHSGVMLKLPGLMVPSTKVTPHAPFPQQARVLPAKALLASMETCLHCLETL